jgi:hypothetical protein
MKFHDMKSAGGNGEWENLEKNTKNPYPDYTPPVPWLGPVADTLAC